MKYYSGPIHWDVSFPAKLSSLLNHDECKLISVYGCLNNGGFKSGRSPLPHQDVDFGIAREILSEIHLRGLAFYYLVNVLLTPDYTQKSCAMRIERLFGEIPCDAVVVADIRLARTVRLVNTAMPIHVSTVAGIKDAHDLEVWSKIAPERVVLHHDMPKKPFELEVLISSLLRADIIPEMMVTESCLFECPFRREHYLALGNGDTDRKFHAACLAQRVSDEAELIAAGSFIRPQDVQWYVKTFGIEHFKISGRSQTLEWKLKTLQAYLMEQFDGNLIELTGMDPEIKPGKRFSLPAAVLDGYIERLLTTQCDNRQLAHEFSKALSGKTDGGTML